MVAWLFVAAARAGTVRALVEVGSGAPVLIDAWPGGAAPLPAEGALAVVADDGRVLATGAARDPRRRSLIGPDGGGEAGTLPSGLVLVDLPWPEGAARLVLGPRELRPAPRRASGGAVPLQASGPSESRLDLVFLGDGYPEAELGRYHDDVDRVVDHLLGLEPYDQYGDLVNVWRVDLVSRDAGVSHLEGDGVARDTALGCYYGCLGIDRLVCCDDARVMAAATGPVPGADGIMVLVNDPTYGGSGGFNYAVAYNGPVDGHEVATHELGHTLVGLWDEYDYGQDGDGEGPNCAADPAGSWDEWKGSQGVDAFPSCSYPSLVRPTEDGCMMRTLREGYCAVCRQETIYAIYSHLDALVARVEPAPGTELDARSEELSIELELTGPRSGLRVEWLDGTGEVVATDTTGSGSSRVELELCGSGVDGPLYARVFDDTPWVRADPYGVTEELVGPWEVRARDRCDPLLGCGCRPGGAAAAGWAASALAWIAVLRRRR